jgi:hypothetical protein
VSPIDRRREEGRRAGQYYRGGAGRRLTASRLFAVLLLLVSADSHAQSLIRIQILEGEGSVNSAGSKSERPIAVQLTDETGRPLESVAVSFRMPEEGPSGVFEGGMKTDIAVTTADGRAAVRGVRWNRIAGPFQIRVTAAKGESRAGAICSQYISDVPVAKAAHSGHRGRAKWMTIAAITAGGAAAGLVATRSHSPQQPSRPPVVAQPVQIGLPTISIGRP